MQHETEPVLRYVDWAINFYELETAWSFVKAFHTPDLGYHNLDHIKVVMGASVWLSLQEGVNPRLPLVAAMFHDMRHKGKQPDRYNIDIALWWLSKAAGLRNMANTPVLDLSGSDFVTVRDAISSTCYEGKFTTEPKCKVAEILRDADLWMPHLLPENARSLLWGLFNETKVFETQTLTEFVTKAKEFYSNVTWYTQTAQQMASQIPHNLSKI